MAEQNFTDDELAYQRGQEAEAFMRFCQEGEQYFLKLMESMTAELRQEILDLDPMSTQRFTVLKAQLNGITDPMTRVLSDIMSGKQAWMRINNLEDKTKGIL
jgi:hypothetical protein